MIGVNIFGQQGKKSFLSSQQGPPGIGFKYLDEDQNFDLNNRRLANISFPIDEFDATNKKFVDELLENLRLHLRKYIEVRENIINENYQNRSDTIQASLYENTIGFQEKLGEITTNLDAYSRISEEKIEVFRMGTLEHTEFVKNEIKRLEEEVIKSMKLDYTNLERLFNDMNSYTEQFRNNLHQQDRETIINSTEIENLKKLSKKLVDDNADIKSRLKSLENTMRRETIEAIS